MALLTAAPYTIAAVGTIANAWHSKRCSASLTWFLTPKEETLISKEGSSERRFDEHRANLYEKPQACRC